MAETYKVAFIGTGRPRGQEGSTGFGMAYGHADGYIASGKCELVAAADINDTNAKAFAEHGCIRREWVQLTAWLTRLLRPDGSHRVVR